MGTLQATGTRQFERPAVTVTTQIDILNEALVVANTGNQVDVEFWETLNVDADLTTPAVAHIQTITITQGTTGDVYHVLVDDGVGSAEGYAFLQVGTPGANAIASGLAKALDASGYVKATASTNVITVTGIIPGRTITFDKSNSTDDTKLVIAETQAESGTAIRRKMAKGVLKLDIHSTTGKLILSGSAVYYDGTESAISTNSSVETTLGSSIKTLDGVMTANGIDRV